VTQLVKALHEEVTQSRYPNKFPPIIIIISILIPKEHDLNHTGNCMYHQAHNQKLYLLPSVLVSLEIPYDDDLHLHMQHRLILTFKQHFSEMCLQMPERYIPFSSLCTAETVKAMNTDNTKPRPHGHILLESPRHTNTTAQPNYSCFYSPRHRVEMVLQGASVARCAHSGAVSRLE